MLGHIQYFSEFRQGLIVASLHARQVEPAELDREHVLQHCGQEEGRHGDADHGNDGGEIIREAVLLLRGADAQRDRDEDFKNEADETQRKAVPDGIVELLGDGDGPCPALAPFAPYSAFQPRKVAPNNALVHTVLRVQIGEPLGVALACAGTGGQFSRFRLEIAHRHIVHQYINQEHDEEQNQSAVKQTFYSEFQHSKQTSLQRMFYSPGTGGGRGKPSPAFRAGLTQVLNVDIEPYLAARVSMSAYQPQ